MNYYFFFFHNSYIFFIFFIYIYFSFIKPRRKKDYTPVSWDTCFDSCRDIKIPDSEDISFYFQKITQSFLKFFKFFKFFK